MGIVPKLIGGIEVRERKPRYAGEPRYKRMDFIKHKSRPKEDDYSLVRTTYPRPQAQQYGPPWLHPHWDAFPYDEQRRLLAQLGYNTPPPPQQFPQLAGRGGYGGDPPAPPLHGLPGHQPRMIGPAEAAAEGIVALDPSDDDDDDDEDSEDDIKVRVIKPKSKLPTGHSVFGSDSEDDRSSRYTGSSRTSIITSHSSVPSSVSTRYRVVNRKGKKGW